MKNLKFKKISLLLLLATLFSCVEGRSGRTSASQNDELKNKDALNFDIELELAYSQQQFSTILDSLNSIFPSLDFTHPTEITSLTQCPSKISSHWDALLYQSYLDQLNIAHSKYSKAAIATSSKRLNLSNSADMAIMEAVLERLLTEQALVKSHVNTCKSSLDSYNSNPADADCSSEASKELAATNKMQAFLNIKGGTTIINKANTLFSTNPIIEFSSYLDLHSKVNCEEIANQNKMRAVDYVETILKPLSQPIDQAITSNNPDLSSSDACIKEIAQKTLTLLDTFRKSNNAKNASCNASIENLKPAIIYVGTGDNSSRGELSVSKDGGKSFKTATGLVGADGHGKRDVHAIVAEGANVYLATEAGVAISSNYGTSFTNFKIKYENDKYAHVQSIMIDGNDLIASTWEDGAYKVINKFGKNMSRIAGNNRPSKSFHDVCILSGDDKVYYAATESGLGISVDKGVNFYASHTTADGLLQNRIVSVSCTGDTVFAATHNGISASKDGGGYISLTNATSQLASNTVHKVFVKNNKLIVATALGVSVATITADLSDIKFTKNYKMPFFNASTQEVRDVHMDDQGNIYAAVKNGGLAVLEFGETDFKYKNTGLPNLYVISVFTTKQ